MNPIKTIILGVVANGFWAMLAFVGQKLLVPGRHDEKLQRLENLLTDALDQVGEDFSWSGPGSEEEVALFLQSSEMSAIVDSLFIACMMGGSAKASIPTLRQQFLHELSLYLDVEPSRIAESSSRLFGDTVSAIEAALRVSADRGHVPAHEALSQLRFNLIKDQLSSIDATVKFLSQPQALSPRAIHDWEQGYLAQVPHRHGYIKPPNLDTIRKVPIDKLFVAPKLSRILSPETPAAEEIPVYRFLQALTRAVILGNPGGGKSTLVSKICTDIAIAPSKYPVASRQVTPFIVVLREYGVQKRNHNLSVLEFIETNVKTSYQTPPPPGVIEYLLLTGRGMVVFDGLDELLDTGFRRQITDDVELFCTRYARAPVLVTSREVGYDQVPLDPSRFESLKLAPFDPDQVADYVNKWFAIPGELSELQAKDRTASFMRESEIVPDLRSNPLMLGLICNIYRGSNYIPKNRPDLYSKCATMLFDRWDKMREIAAPQSIEAIEHHLRPTMMYIAAWIYSSDALQAGVPEGRLVKRAADYLHNRRFEDRDEAEKYAFDFISFCRGRAWVLTDTGSTETGERLFQFTHRTFLEYFTASHLVRTHHSAPELASQLLPYIEKSEWDIVCQLSFQILSKHVEGGADELTEILLKSAAQARGRNAWNILVFSARCLQFLVPSPKTTRKVVEHCLEKCFRSRQSMATEAKRSTGGSDLSQLVLSLLIDSTKENHKTIRDSFKQFLQARLHGESTRSVLGALEIIFHIVNRRLTHQRYHSLLENRASWEEFRGDLLSEELATVQSVAQRTPWVAIVALYSGHMSFESYLACYGWPGVFRGADVTGFFHGIWKVPPAIFLVFHFVQCLSGRENVQVSHELLFSSVASAILSAPTPILSSEDMAGSQRYYDMFFSNFHEAGETLSTDFVPSADVLFAGAALMAVIVEATKDQKLLTGALRGPTSSPAAGPIAGILDYRLDPVKSEVALKTGLDRLSLRPAQRALLTEWARGVISFVGQE